MFCGIFEMRHGHTDVISLLCFHFILSTLNNIKIIILNVNNNLNDKSHLINYNFNVEIIVPNVRISVNEFDRLGTLPSCLSLKH